MKQYPTLHIENFARIRQADIELAPLTLFVGDNNSGKTYLSTLIWGLEDLLRCFTHELIKTEVLPPALRTLHSQIEENAHKTEYECEFAITRELHDEIQDLLDKTLNNRTIVEKWIGDLFHSDGLSIGKISLSIPYQEGFRLHVKKIEHDSHNGTRALYQCKIWRGKKTHSVFSNFLLSGVASADSVSTGSIMRVLISRYVNSSRIGTGRQSYFPDSRNGILRTYPSIVKESIETRFGSNYMVEDAYQLTSPQREFLKQLVDYSARKTENRRISGRFENSKFGKIVDFIESKMIRGQIILNQEGLVEFLYKPQHLDQPISMNLSSGVVTSLVPLLAALKYDSVGYRCFIEEPEMSLHPALEWRMAQVLVRLANAIEEIGEKGFVLATTHSTTIIQHVNNMIKLANRSDGKTLAEKYGYTSGDIISPEKVRMYQFDVIENEALTEVRLLDCNKNGFAVPTFGQSLRNLKDQIWAFQNEDE